MENIKNRRRAKKKKSDSNAWLTSLADLMSLILTFFVLVYSMSEVPKKKWIDVSSSLSDFFKGDRSEFIPEFDLDNVKSVKNEKKKAFDITYLKTIIKNLKIRAEKSPVKYDIQQDYFSIIIPLDYLIFTAIDNPLLTKNGEVLLFNLSKVYSVLSNQMEVKVIGESREKSMLINDFISGKIEELGYEYNVYRVIVDNLDIQNNEEKIVEIIFRPYESYI